MVSLARRHFQATVAARETAAAAETPTAELGSAYDKMLALLKGHNAALKQLKSIKAKIETKRDFLPEYEGYVDGVMSSRAGVQDDVLVTVMVWRLDVGDFDAALDIAAYALDHKLAMPAAFSRDVATTVLEEIADAAIDNPDPAMTDPVETAMVYTADADMPDEVRAKGYKALGLIVEETDAPKAIEHFKAALDLNPKCGVKTKLNRLQKQTEPDTD